jgi:hypothetical protein
MTTNSRRSRMSVRRGNGVLIAREVALDEPQEPDENTEKQHEREDVEHLHPRQRVGVGSQNAGSAPPVAALTKQPSQKLGKEVFQFPLLSNAAQRRCGASPPRGHGGTHDSSRGLIFALGGWV